MSNGESDSISEEASEVGQEEPARKPPRLPVSFSSLGVARECLPEDLVCGKDAELSSEEEEGEVAYHKSEICRLIDTAVVGHMIRHNWPNFFTNGGFKMPDSPKLKEATDKIRGILETRYKTAIKGTHDFLAGAMRALQEELEGPLRQLTEIIENENGPLESAHIEKLKARRLKALERKRKNLEEEEERVNNLGPSKHRSKKCGKREDSDSSPSDDDSSYSESE